jgi:ribosomal subunit interface protein
VRTIVKGKNTEVPDRVREYAERKMGRLERILDERSDAIVELSNEQHRSAADAHIVEVTLVVDGQMIRSHATGPTYQAAIDAVVDRVERQAIEHKEKPRHRSRPPEEKEILAKLADGTAEPTTWQLTVTNSTPALQASGGIGLRAYRPSATTNGPVVFKFDDLVAKTL